MSLVVVTYWIIIKLALYEAGFYLGKYDTNADVVFFKLRAVNCYYRFHNDLVKFEASCLFLFVFICWIYWHSNHLLLHLRMLVISLNCIKLIHIRVQQFFYSLNYIAYISWKFAFVPFCHIVQNLAVWLL